MKTRENKNSMATLFLLCGLPGSGKTTLAKQLERDQPALRLTPDEWIGSLLFDPYDESKREKVESLQWQVATQALHLGVNVILDWGFWSRQERDDFRSRAEKLGAQSKVIFLNVPRENLLARLETRNAALTKETFHVTQEQLSLWSNLFEPPTQDEL